MNVDVRRIYDDHNGGVRVLVDRLWPRGMRKDRANIDRWMKDVAPSTELRQWYDHDPQKFTEFVRRYHAELDISPACDSLQELRGLAAKRDLTLLTSTKRVEYSHAAVLAAMLEDRT